MELTNIIIVMGVSGCGKSTVGQALADRLGLVFIEGDHFHPPENVAKMAAGRALTNHDRRAWIARLCSRVNAAGSAVVACSAINRIVRGWLLEGLQSKPRYVWLTGSERLLAERLATRRDHFFDPALLSSQFQALEPPVCAVPVPVDQSVSDVVDATLRGLNGDD